MSQTNELTPKQAAECRLNYPPGTRILLEHMDDMTRSRGHLYLIKASTFKSLRNQYTNL